MPRYDDLPFAPLPGRGASEAQLWQAMRFEIFTTLRVAVPATVTAWTPAVPGTRPATVDVRLDFKVIRAIDNPLEVDVSKGEKLLTTTEGIYAVGRRAYKRRPYMVPSVGGAFSMRGPIAVGTCGLYIVADRNIDEWLSLGGPVDPATADKHDFNDGFFLPLVYHGKNAAEIPQDKHQLGPDDGTAGLEIAIADKSIAVKTDGPTANLDAATAVQLGNATGPLLAVARQTDDVSATPGMAAFMSAVVTALNTIAAAVPVVIVPPVPPAGPIGTITSGSAKVQAE